MNLWFILDKAARQDLRPDALRDGDKSFSYPQVADRARRLAGVLSARGVTAGDRVSGLLLNGHQYYELYFACALLGAIFNPLNVRLNPTEIARLMDHAGAKVLVAEADLARNLADDLAGVDSPAALITIGDGAVSGRIETSDYETALQETEPFRGDPPPTTSQTPAHLYYTSGTTGRPKGVVLTHGNVAAHALGAAAELSLIEADVWLHGAPLFHLADAWAVFALTWVSGGHVFVPRFEPAKVLGLMERTGVTTTNLVPTMWNLLVNEPSVRDHDFSALRIVLSGGAPIAPALIEKIVAAFGADYAQTYGLTETAPYVTISIPRPRHHALEPAERLAVKATTGREFLTASVRLVDDQGLEVPADGRSVGEIWVQGPTVFSHYWQNEAATAEAFEDGWFKTGDLAVRDAQGYLTIVDRKKDVIITGGENVYTTEVENVLYRHPAVLEAAVIGVPDDKWGEAVVGCVALKEGRGASAEELIAFCRRELAGFKTPKRIVFLDELPKTGSGKLYKQGLKDMMRQ
ncbi:MAG: long-chain-fatty-acid--CoA ligase [Proteobacteria bacterium]|nr:long-chain-fatty-acid--CoA ligase [Pseudomonadota bacterium]